jgi:hypothetical protein
MLFPANEEGGLEKALEGLCEKAEKEVQGGATVLILSDRGITGEQAPIPSLLATAAVHHHLVRAGIRTRTTLIVETAEVREGHHFALLVGYGATAVNPYLAFETIEDMVETGLIGDVTPEEATKNFVKAIEKALLKIISKMGISTLFSYCGAQIFEVVGLSDEVVERYFTRTPSRIGGIGLEEIEEEVLQRHRRAFAKIEDGPEELEVGGEYQFRVQGPRPHVEPVQHPAAAAGRPNGELRDLQAVRGLLQRAEREPVHPSRPHGHRAGPDSVGGGRAGEGDRQALLDGGYIFRLNFPGVARDFGYRDEPHRRQVEHRRGGRELRALHAGLERRSQAQRDQAGRERAFRGDDGVPGQRRRFADKDGPGLQAR